MGLTRRQKRNKVVREARRIIVTANEGGEFDACETEAAAELHARELLEPANYQVTVYARLSVAERRRAAGIPNTAPRFAFIVGPLEGPAPGSMDREAKEAKALRMEWSANQRKTEKFRRFPISARHYRQGLAAESFRKAFTRLCQMPRVTVGIDYAVSEARILRDTYAKMFPQADEYLKMVQPGNYTFQVDKVTTAPDGSLSVDLKEVKK